MKRSICFALVLAFTAAFVFAGGGSSSSSGGKLPLRYYMPGGPATDVEIVKAAINEALAKDGLNYDYQPIYVPWDQWGNRTNLMLSTGEEFELIHIMENGGTPTSVYVGRNALRPLSQIIRTNTPQLTGRFDPVLWEGVTIRGEVYAIPAYWRAAWGDQEGVVIIRKDMYDRFGIAYPQNTDQMLTAVQTLQTRWMALDNQRRYVYEHAPERPPTALHRTYDAWPFYVSFDGVFQVLQNGEANLYYETPEFRRDAEFMNTLYSRQMIDPDILNLPRDTQVSRMYDNGGDFLLNLMTGPQNTAELNRETNIPGAEILRYSPMSDKPYLTTEPLLNSNGVPLGAKNPEVGVKFLEWLYSNRANYDMLIHGVPGRHWNAVGTDGVNYVRNAEGNTTYWFDSWMIGFAPWVRWDVTSDTPQETKDGFSKNMFPNQTVTSPVVGFNFDSEPVRVEMANVLAEYTASILPIKMGVLPYAANFTAAQTRMRAAGSERLIAEYRRQLAAFIASKR